MRLEALQWHMKECVQHILGVNMTWLGLTPFQICQVKLRKKILSPYTLIITTAALAFLLWLPILENLLVGLYLQLVIFWVRCTYSSQTGDGTDIIHGSQLNLLSHDLTNLSYATCALTILIFECTCTGLLIQMHFVVLCYSGRRFCWSDRRSLYMWARLLIIQERGCHQAETC